MSMGCQNMSTGNKNKTCNVENDIVSMCMTQKDTGKTHLRFCKVSRAKGIADDKENIYSNVIRVIIGIDMDVHGSTIGH